MRLLPSDPDVETIVSRIQSGDIDLQPDFQRGEVWGRLKKQRLIDSILRDWHVPPIHVIENAKTRKHEVLDGQQRLAAIRDFVDGQFPVNGQIEPPDSGIQSLDGIYFRDLSEEWRRRFKDDPDSDRKSTREQFDGVFLWLDPSYLANLYVNKIHQDQNFEDLLESITPQQLTGEELLLVSYLVNRRYDEIRIYEISDYEDFDVFPYFRASSAGSVYGSEGMGRGELSLLICYWTLKNAPKNSILIVEDPETHVSPQSQDCLMNIIAKFSDEMGIWCLLATHSPTIIRRIPPQHVKLLARRHPTSMIVNNPKQVDIATILGGGVAFNTALLVEDEEARGFVLAVLEELDPDLLSQVEVVPTRSAAEIAAALRNMPMTREWFTLVGSYDGDQRECQRRETQWPIVFLPSPNAPGQALKILIDESADINEKLVTELHKTEATVALALDHVTGADHHDLVGELAGALNSTVPVVRKALVRIWLQQGSNTEEALAFIQQVREGINSARVPDR